MPGSGEVPSEGLRVVVVDDHPMWRKAVAGDLAENGFDVVGEADSVRKALVVAAATRPQVLVVDLQLPDGSGVDVVKEHLQLDPEARALVLSASGEPPDVLAAMKAGATGYLVKSASAADLRSAVVSVASGRSVFTPGVAGLVLGEYQRISKDPAAPVLSDREVEVLRLVAKGLSSKQIASRLFLSHRTVENHVNAMLRKLQLHNRVELTRWGLDQNLLDDSE